jgi:extradiol dioxygenase family protein
MRYKIVVPFLPNNGQERFLWCITHFGVDFYSNTWFRCSGKVSEDGVTYEFKYKKDAMLFALRWS